MKYTGKPKLAINWQSVDDQRIGLLRLLLAFSALLIIYIDPSEPDRFVGITFTVLSFYCVYSIFLYLFGVPQKIKFIGDYAHWIDVVWFSLLISLSSGTGSIFFYFYLFAILIASFRWGFTSGLRVTGASTAIFLFVGFIFSVPDDIEINRVLLRPVYLLGVGYLVSFWGGRELLHRKRLGLLNEVSNLSNPRSGAIKSLSSILESVRRFYDADSCLLLFQQDADYSFNWLEADRSNGGNGGINPENTDAGTPLLNLPGGYSILFNGKRHKFYENGIRKDKNLPDSPSEPERADICSALADILGAQSILTIPVSRREQSIGRIYLTSGSNGFQTSDMEFLKHLADHVFPSIENMRLMDSLASEAIDRQRQKISFDIHDSTIQPYIGLKLGLEALELRAVNDPALSEEIRNLINMADSTIADLRNFVSDLKNKERTGNVLAAALEQQARKFQEYYGIKVVINNDCDLSKNDRLAAEVFQMVAEGLSNIRRHTKAKEAQINVFCEGENVILEIENRVMSPTNEFLPKSLAARTGYLGGRLNIECDAGFTRVTLKIPRNAEIK